MIYKIRADRNRYMNAYISPDEADAVLGDFFLLDEERWSDFWKPLAVSFTDDSDSGKVVAIPDITVWGTTFNLVCSQAAKEKIGKGIEEYGEWLPVHCEGNSYWLFHPTNRLGVDVVDINVSERSIEAGGYAEATKLSLLPGELEKNSLFLTEYNGFKNLYSSGVFKYLVESNNLKGLRFSSNPDNSPN